MNIWHFSEQVSSRLLRWNVLNILIGLLLLPRRAFWRGLGSQAIGWGLINSAIAILGNEATRQRRLKLEDSYSTPRLNKESHNLRSVLWINTVLDVVYMIGGGLYDWRVDVVSLSKARRWGETRCRNRHHHTRWPLVHIRSYSRPHRAGCAIRSIR